MTILFAASALLAVSQAARPAPATAAQDASCLALFASIAAEPATKDAGAAGALYFTGKLLGRDPAIDLGATLAVAAPMLTDNARVATEGKRCGAELEAISDTLKAAG